MDKDNIILDMFEKGLNEQQISELAEVPLKEVELILKNAMIIHPLEVEIVK